MAKKPQVFSITATLPKGYKAPKKAKKPVTIEDIKAFIKQSREDYGLDDYETVDELWERGRVGQVGEAGRQEGREEVLNELADYLKRGN